MTLGAESCEPDPFYERHHYQYHGIFYAWDLTEIHPSPQYRFHIQPHHAFPVHGGFLLNRYCLHLLGRNHEDGYDIVYEFTAMVAIPSLTIWTMGEILYTGSLCWRMMVRTSGVLRCHIAG